MKINTFRHLTVFIVCIFQAFSLCSCRQKVNVGSYLAYVNDERNGLKKTTVVDRWEMSSQFKPSDYIIILENKGVMDDGKEISRRKSELQGTAWFNIKIRKTDTDVNPIRYGVSSVEEYNDRLNYYLNRADKHISLKYGGRQLQAESYAFENNYNLTPDQTFVVGFRLPENELSPSTTMILSFNDSILNLKFDQKFEYAYLKKIPEVSY